MRALGSMRSASASNCCPSGSLGPLAAQALSSATASSGRCFSTNQAATRDACARKAEMLPSPVIALGASLARSRPRAYGFFDVEIGRLARERPNPLFLAISAESEAGSGGVAHIRVGAVLLQAAVHEVREAVTLAVAAQALALVPALIVDVLRIVALAVAAGAIIGAAVQGFTRRAITVVVARLAAILGTRELRLELHVALLVPAVAVGLAAGGRLAALANAVEVAHRAIARTRAGRFHELRLALTVAAEAISRTLPGRFQGLADLVVVANATVTRAAEGAFVELTHPVAAIAVLRAIGRV